MNIKPIKKEKDYENALQRIDNLWGSKKGTPKGDELEILITLVEVYENKHYPIEIADPIKTIEYVMQEKSMKRSDMATIFGNKGLVSDVLNKKKALTIKMIKSLHDQLGIPYDLLIT